VGAALGVGSAFLEESAMDGGVLTLLLVRRISREIKHKRVTSVEVNRFTGKLVKGPALSRSPAMDGRVRRRGICT
jgi:hypothetical protein